MFQKDPQLHRLTLVKGDEEFHFSWTPEDKEAMLDHFDELARSRETSFDEFDASVMRFQAQRLSGSNVPLPSLECEELDLD